MKEFEEKTLQSEKIYEGKIVNLKKDKVRIPDGNIAIREIVEHSGGVTILPLTSDNKIPLVKQYRKPVEEVLLELPAGKLEEGEKPEACAWRELWEETGYKAEKIKEICFFYTSPGFSNEKLYLFMAEELDYKPGPGEKGEFITTELINPRDIFKLIYEGTIKDAKTIIGLLYYLQEMEVMA